MKTKFYATYMVLTVIFTLASCSGGGGGGGEEVSVSSPAAQPAPVKSITVDVPTDLSTFNATDSAPTSTGTCSEEDENININVNTVNVSSTTCTSGAFSFSLDLSWLSEGSNTVEYAYDSGEKAEITLEYDSVVPTLTIDSLAAINASNYTSYSFSGTCSEDGSIDGTIGTTPVSGSCTSGIYSISTIDTTAEADGTVNFSFTVTDAAGNVSTAQTDSTTKDIVIPTLTLNALTNITSANVTNYSVSGTCSDDGVNVDLTIGAFTSSVACSTGTFSFSALDVSAAAENVSTTVNVSQTDAILNTGSANSTIVKDTIAPTLTIDSPATITQINESFYSVSGTCSEDGRPVTGTLDVVPFSTTCSSGTWLYSAINVAFLGDGTYTLSVSMEDDYANATGTITDSATKDTTATLPTIAFLTPASGYGNANSVTIRLGDINSGDTIDAYSDGSCTSLIRSETSTGTTHDMTFTNSSEGSHSYYFIVTDSTPASTPCLGPKVYIEDQTAPAAPLTISMSSPADGSTSNDSTPIFSGTIASAEEGATIAIFRDGSCTDQIGSDVVSNGSFSVLTTLAVDGTHNGLNQFYVQSIDKAGNTSSCSSTSLSYTLSGGGLATLPKLAMVGSNSPTSLISLEDGNQITWTRAADPGNPIDLGTINAGDVISIQDPSDANIKVSQGDRIDSTKACYAVTEGFGTAPWASEAYAGTKFTTFQYRYGERSPKVYVAAIGQTSFVQILQDTDGDGDLDVVDYQNIPGGTVHEFTVTLVNNRPWQVVSDQKINVYYLATSGGAYDKDARVLTPAATDIIGFSWYVTAVEDNTTINAYQNYNAANYSGTININGSLDTGRTLKTNLERWATRVTSDKPVAQLQIADQDGINATPHLPVNMLATHYGIPRAADYVGIITLVDSTVQVINPDGSIKGTYNLTKDAGADALAPYALKYTDGASVAAGTRFICSNPCFMIYDDEGSGADEDETLMMGFSP